ncbi:MAG TPA: N-acetyl-alpha-D-glucosaminyl L-malate synthase BshA [Opitutae bacterium]|nr:N-acetyl-alpha-D-glucosaminyl L-malate synthase BshA [Opitutaceae bacterium]HCR31049.1 N-acetyl-alpha-D-glucosaminyl L-malate synthase BshA [Opitutae bacterium]
MEGKLNIALLCHPTVGGSGILATELGHRLAELGHSVYVVSERPPFRLDDSHPNIHFCESTPVEFPLFKSPDHTLPFATRIADVCRNHRIDIMHAHYAIPHTAAAWIAKELIGEASPPTVTTLHGTDIIYLGAKEEYRPLLQHVLNASDRVTCVSKNLKERTEALFSLEQEIAVIPNFYEPKPVSRDRDQVRAPLDCGDIPLAIHASNLRTIKRVDLLLEGFKRALNQCDARLLILAGADATRIEPEIQKRDLQDKVIIESGVYDVDEYYAAADFTLFSSEYESFCLGILEGMRHGKPSVSFEVGGIPEVVEANETGLLAPFGDVDALGKAIASLANDSELRKRMGKKAEQRAREQFSAETVVDAYLDIYWQELARA